jgi:putative peptidoglycan lipid II flippase
MAHYFGANGLTDAYNIAFRIPNLLRRVFAEGAFSQAFVPILAQYKTQKGQDEAKLLVDHVGTVLTWTLVLTCLVGIAAAPIITYSFATGWSDKPAVFDAAVVMTRIMFPYIGFISLVSLGGSILNTWREFRIPAFTPVLLNIASILTMVLLSPHLAQPVYALAIGVFIGGVLQLGIQVPALIKIGMLPRISFRLPSAYRDPGVRTVLRKMGPAIFAVSAAQLSILINSNWTSHMQLGSVTWLAYADRLMEFPTALLGVALGTILLPSLSKAHSEGDSTEYSALLDWGLRLTFMLALPCAVALATISIPLTTTLFHGEAFKSADAIMTARALVAYGVGLIGLIVVKILAPGFYAKQNIRTPVKIAIGVLIASQVMNIFFVPYLAHAGLALSVGLGACLNAMFLYFGLRRHQIYTPHPGWLTFMGKIVIALGLMAAMGVWSASYFNWLGMPEQKLLRFGALMLVIGASGVTYLGALFAMGFRLRDFKRISM